MAGCAESDPLQAARAIMHTNPSRPAPRTGNEPSTIRHCGDVRSGIVALQPTQGLANRLRAISSFNVLARRTGRDFRLCWAPSQGFSTEDLNELVANEFTRIDQAEFHALCAAGLVLDHASLSAGESLGEGQPVLTYRGYLPVAVARDDYHAELTTWQPSAAIAHVVTRIAAEFDANTVGVHVRRGDALLNPRLGWKYRISSDRAFFARMDGLIRAEPRTVFFLATDDAATEARFRSRYGDALRTNTVKLHVPSLLGEPKDNQRDAAIDLFALSRTSRVLGNHASTFSSLAANIGRIPLERATDTAVVARLRRRVERMLRR